MTKFLNKLFLLDWSNSFDDSHNIGYLLKKIQNHCNDLLSSFGTNIWMENKHYILHNLNQLYIFIYNEMVISLYSK